MTIPWRILQLADSAFPVGGFAHSAGLEAALQLGEIDGAERLRGFVLEVLWQVGHGALPLVRAAHATPSDIAALDRLCDAFLSSTVANRASRTQGRAFSATCARVFAAPEIAELDALVRAKTIFGHYSPLFGAAMNALDVGERDAQRLALYLALRGVTSAAVRLGALGPHEAQRLQDTSAGDLERVLDACANLSTDDLTQPAPLVELVGSSHDRLYSRLFQS